MDDFLAEFENLLSVVRDRIELIAKFRDFLNQRPILAVIKIENIGTAGPLAPVSIARAKMTDDFRAFVAALKADQGDTGIRSGSLGDIGHGLHTPTSTSAS